MLFDKDCEHRIVPLSSFQSHFSWTSSPATQAVLVILNSILFYLTGQPLALTGINQAIVRRTYQAPSRAPAMTTNACQDLSTSRAELGHA